LMNLKLVILKWPIGSLKSEENKSRFLKNRGCTDLYSQCLKDYLT